MSKTLFVTPWTITHQAPLSMGFSRQEYWSGLPVPSWGGSSWPRDRTCVSALHVYSLPLSRQASLTEKDAWSYLALNQSKGNFSGVNTKQSSVLHYFFIVSALFLHFFFLRALSPITIVSNRIHMQRSHSFLFLARASSFTIHPLHCQAA